MSLLRAEGLLWLCLLLAGCGSGANAADAASDLDARREPNLELMVGTGRDDYQELDASGTLVLERGPQGLQHVYVSVRAPVEEGLHRVELTVEGEDRVLSAPTRMNAPFLGIPASPMSECLGLLVVIPSPDGYTDGRTATLRVEVESRGGDRGLFERPVQLRW
jgi:hypothetical protein